MVTVWRKRHCMLSPIYMKCPPKRLRCHPRGKDGKTAKAQCCGGLLQKGLSWFYLRVMSQWTSSSSRQAESSSKSPQSFLWETSSNLLGPDTLPIYPLCSQAWPALFMLWVPGAGRVSYNPGCLLILCAASVNLRRLIFLPQYPNGLGLQACTSVTTLWVLGMEPKASWMPGKRSTDWAVS